jgi:hypothetical protein
MKKGFLVFSALLASGTSMADSFVCTNAAHGLNVQVDYNTQPELGTQTAAVMFLSEATTQTGHKTIVRLTRLSSALSSSIASYVANVVQVNWTYFAYAI